MGFVEDKESSSTTEAKATKARHFLIENASDLFFRLPSHKEQLAFEEEQMLEDIVNEIKASAGGIVDVSVKLDRPQPVALNLQFRIA